MPFGKLLQQFINTLWTWTWTQYVLDDINIHKYLHNINNQLHSFSNIQILYIYSICTSVADVRFPLSENSAIICIFIGTIYTLASVR